MDTKNGLKKFTISVALLLLGTFSSMYLSISIHLLLTDGLKEIRVLNMFNAIKILISDKRVLSLFLALEIGAIFLSILYYFMKDNYYKSELVKITPNIKIPVSAGQMQFGSARFATEEEKEKMFTIYDMDKIRQGDDYNIGVKKTSFSGRWISNRAKRKSKKG